MGIPITLIRVHAWGQTVKGLDLRSPGQLLAILLFVSFFWSAVICAYTNSVFSVSVKVAGAIAAVSLVVQLVLMWRARGRAREISD